MPGVSLRFLGVGVALGVLACQQAPPQTNTSATNELNGEPRLPTGAHLDPVGASWPVGSMPLAMVLAPGGRQVVVLLNGWREQGIQVLDRQTGQLQGRDAVVATRGSLLDPDATGARVPDDAAPDIGDAGDAGDARED